MKYRLQSMKGEPRQFYLPFKSLLPAFNPFTSPLPIPPPTKVCEAHYTLRILGVSPVKSPLGPLCFRISRNISELVRITP